MKLDLKKKGLTSLPPGLDLSQVTDLQLWDNQLATVPEPILAMTQLQVLNLGNNPLTRLPQGLSALKNLESLTLYLCPLTVLPDWLADLPKLEFLWFSNRKELASVSPRIGGMPSLQRLVIANDYAENELGRYLKEVERFCGQMNPTKISDFTKRYVGNPKEGWDALETEEFGAVGGKDGFVHRVNAAFSSGEARKKWEALKLSAELFIEADTFFADRAYETSREQELKEQPPARRAALLAGLEAMRQDLEKVFPSVVTPDCYDSEGRFLADCLKYPRDVAVHLKEELDKAFRVLT